MSKFLTNLIVNQITDSVFELAAGLVYECDLLKCTITVPTGFQSDGASVPRIPVVYEIFGNRAHHEAVLHDYLYRSDAVPAATYSQANNVFLEAMKERGKPFFVRWAMYLGVVSGGWTAFHKKKVADTLCN